MSDKTETERRALPWYDPEAIPRFEGDATYCRHPDCRDTNWGGRDRVHQRSSICPPLPTAADQPTTEPSDETIATLRDDLQGARDRLADALNARYEAAVARAERAEAALLAPQPAADTETEVQARALREAADEMDNTDDPDAIHVSNGDIDLWLRARADRIERGEEA